jgi:hypothetical protein
MYVRDDIAFATVRVSRICCVCVGACVSVCLVCMRDFESVCEFVLGRRVCALW